MYYDSNDPDTFTLKICLIFGILWNWTSDKTCHRDRIACLSAPYPSFKKL